MKRMKLRELAPEETTSEWRSVAEAAELLGVTKQTVLNKIRVYEYEAASFKGLTLVRLPNTKGETR